MSVPRICCSLKWTALQFIGCLPVPDGVEVVPGEGEGRARPKLRQAPGGRAAGQPAAVGTAVDARDPDQERLARLRRLAGDQRQPHEVADVERANLRPQLDVVD